MELLKVIIQSTILLGIIAGCGKNMKSEITKPVNLSFESKDTKNVVFQSKFFTKSNKELKPKDFDSGQKRIFVLFSSPRCAACKEEHQLIKKSIDDSTLDSSKFEIISFMIATDFSDDYDVISVNELLDFSNMHWPIGEDISMSYFDRFCAAGTTPCSAILEPDLGVVYSHSGIPKIDEIKSILNK